MAGSVYQSDSNATPDSEFLPGGLHHLVAGNRGRLLDARRTPVHVTGVRAETGFFEVEVDAFEDTGARWLVPLESASSYQFAAGGAMAAGPGLEAPGQRHGDALPGVALHDRPATADSPSRRSHP